MAHSRRGHSSDDCDNAPAYTAFVHLLIIGGSHVAVEFDEVIE
jgi:hypothetical protein